MVLTDAHPQIGRRLAPLSLLRSGTLRAEQDAPSSPLLKKCAGSLLPAPTLQILKKHTRGADSVLGISARLTGRRASAENGSQYRRRCTRACAISLRMRRTSRARIQFLIGVLSVTDSGKG